MGRRIFYFLLALLAPAAVASAQAAGRIVGRVTNAEGGAPIVGATVTVVGTTRGALTDSAGRFTLADVPAGARRVQARRIGWISATQSVTVSAGEAVTTTFS